MTAVALLHRDEIIDRVRQGHRMRDIGNDLGVTRQAIGSQLAKDEEFQQAKQYGAEARLEHWEAEMEGLDDDASKVALARTREMLSHARWRASVEHPDVWGEKKQLHVTGSLDLRAAITSSYDPAALGATMGATDIDGESKLITDQ